MSDNRQPKEKPPINPTNDAPEEGTGGQDRGSQAQRMTENNASGPDSPLGPSQASFSAPIPPAVKNGNSRPPMSSPPVMNTIASSGTDGYGSDGRPLQQPPAQSMFNGLYDSDASDGR